MGEKIHNKLVRDKIPDIIQADGGEPVVRILPEDEYRQELLKKLVEEATELLESNGSLDERADVAEVLRAIDELLDFKASDVEQAREQRVDKRGGFKLRIFLEKVTKAD